MSNWRYTTSNDWVIVNNELGEIWKEVVVYFMVTSRHLPWETEEKFQKTLVRIIGVGDEIRTERLPNTSLKRYPMCQLALYWSLSWQKWIHFTLSLSFLLRSILIPSFDLAFLFYHLLQQSTFSNGSAHRIYLYIYRMILVIKNNVILTPLTRWSL
jgi:hypothetical protein